MKPQLFLLSLFTIATFAMAADPVTNQVRRLHPRVIPKQQTNALAQLAARQSQEVRNDIFIFGPRHEFTVPNSSTSIVIQHTNTFTIQEARKWLQEAIRMLH